MACDLTRNNADSLGLSDRITIVQQKINEESTSLPSDAHFDLIVSNPPYVATKEIQKLEPEITLYEDLRALDGGRDGMSVIVPILKVASKYLKSGGALWLEVDPSHPELIEKYLQEQMADLRYINCYKDLFQKDRFVEIVKV
jgi:release factor glutamine methyltransferase